MQQYEVGLMAPLCHKYRSTVKLPGAKEAVPYAFDLMVLACCQRPRRLLCGGKSSGTLVLLSSKHTTRFSF